MVRSASRYRLAVVVAVAVQCEAIASAQPLTQCPVVEQLISTDGTTGSGTTRGATYSYAFENAASATVVGQATTAFSQWTAAGAAPYGPRVTWAPIAANAGAKIRVVAMPGSFQCFQRPLGESCDGQVVFDTGGALTGATLYVNNNMTAVRTHEVVLHEIFHLYGAKDGTAAGTISTPNSGITEISECDATAAGRFSIQREAGYRPDECEGRPCRGPQHPSSPPCYSGSLPNGKCLPDPRYKYPNGNFFWNDPPLGGISSPTTIGTSGAVTLASRDQDGAVKRVDWYVNDQYVFTTVIDPFDLPYSNAAPGVYKVNAVVWDDLGATAWTVNGPVWLTVQSNGGSQSFATLPPWGQINAGQRLFSPDGSRYLEHQQVDGHLVEYINNGPPIWATGFTRSGGGGYQPVVKGIDTSLIPYYDAPWPWDGAGIMDARRRCGSRRIRSRRRRGIRSISS